MSARKPRSAAGITIDHIETVSMDGEQRERATQTLATLIVEWNNLRNAAPDQKEN
ncbi:hypothetical protein [Lentzea indica]|uniref:hypothetical protein n=1 Tax=Lentzea indica TaxID=2604800 RepID=UPI0014391033|nr:hypothetical protein [Lentzea indica]